MNLRPHPALAVALATAVAGTAPLTAAADDPPMVQHCWTVALPVEEIEAGVYSEVDCYEVPEGTPMENPMARGLTTLALIYDGPSGGSPVNGVLGSTCTGFGINFPPGDPWNNVISSTELIACGNAKHWTGNNNTGSNQLVTGTGFVQNMNGTLNNATSSIQYAP